MPNRLDDTKSDNAISEYIILYSLALDIADHAARSEIELYSMQTCEADGRRVFDTQKPREDSVDQECVSIVAKAVRYIDLRGNALPYRMRHSGALVWFEEQEMSALLAG